MVTETIETKSELSLSDLKQGSTCRVRSVAGKGALRQHLLDMGVTPHTPMRLLESAPSGDPLRFALRGYDLTLRRSEAALVSVDSIDQDSPKTIRSAATNSTTYSNNLFQHTDHPGLGEDGIYHVREGNKQPAVPEGATLKFALVGNQNCGKTTLFNQLTGSNQHVGNFPGVTVTGTSGAIRGEKYTEITDLPGIYSLSPYSSEEIVSREFVLHTHPHAIINVVDATNLSRNLYLTTQLLELGIPMVIALNMMDEVTQNGGYVHVNRMERLLGVPVVPISAANGQGIEELKDHAMHVARYQEFYGVSTAGSKDRLVKEVSACTDAISQIVNISSKAAGVPVRFAAAKLVEGDKRITSAVMMEPSQRPLVDACISRLESSEDMDAACAVATARYTIADSLVKNCVELPSASTEYALSTKIDKVLTGKHTAIPCFIGVMAAIFYLTFSLIGPALQNLMELGINALSDVTAQALEAAGVNQVVRSLIVDGIFQGIGAVLLFLPIIVTLFLFLSLLEDTGYMARVAYVADGALRHLGLSGRPVMPLLLGMGCTVPAVMSTRTLPSQRDRKLTVMLTPFMGCSPKLAIYAFLASAFFPQNAAMVMMLVYLAGIGCGIGVALVAKHTVFTGEAVPFMMELPPYRVPSARSVGRLVWLKSKDFLRRAFTVIFAATVLTWFLESFSPGLEMVSDPSQSILAAGAGVIAPLFAPIGLGDWRLVVTLFSGFIAKETVVSTLTLLVGGVASIAALPAATAAALMTFILLYTPCVAAIDAVRREMGGKWALGMVGFQCTLAWVAAFVVHGIVILAGI